jgi:ubiquinone/menaquinone biosynthesis C-methylase UbiE
MSIHHFEFKDDMLKEIYRVLKPNGLLIVREHDFNHSKEMKDLIDLEHALYATVVHEKMDLDKINNFWNTYIGNYFSFLDLKNELSTIHFKSLTKEISIKGSTAYYWCAFRKI